MEEGPPDTRAAASIVDRCPQMLLSCIVKGKLNIRRMLEFQKRSYEEFASAVADLLDTNSLLLKKEVLTSKNSMKNASTSNKKRRKEKHIMFTNPISGNRLLLVACRVSLW